MELIKSPTTQLNLARLEYTIISHFRPVFLFISNPDKNNTIDIIIGCVKFNYLTVQERITHTFTLLNEKCPDILAECHLVIQCYSTEQMENVLMDVFDE